MPLPGDITCSASGWQKLRPQPHDRGKHGQIRQD